MKTKTLPSILLIMLGVFMNGALNAQKLTNTQVVKPINNQLSQTETLNKGLGDDCNNPYIVETDVLPVNYEDTQENGTCGHGNTYDGEVLTGYDNGEDVVYKIQVAEEAQAIVTLDGAISADGSYWHAVALYEGCPDSSSPLTFAKSGGANNPITFNYILEPNKEYFVLVDYFAVGDDICLSSYTINIDISTDIIDFYDLYVAGTQVSELNAGDLSVISGVGGSVTYDNTNKTLALENANINITENVGIKSNINDFKLKLIGDNTIKAEACLIHSKPTEIIGDGSLTAFALGYFSINLYKAPLTIKNCSLDATGTQWGIVGEDGLSGENLIIENATVKASGALDGSIDDIASLTLNNCAITSPEGAVFDENLHAVTLNGEVVQEQIIIEPSSSTQDINQANIELYPNPVSDILHINMAANNFSIELYNIHGQRVLQTQNKCEISTSNLQSGVYMLKITTPKGVYSRSIVKE